MFDVLDWSGEVYYALKTCILIWTTRFLLVAVAVQYDGSNLRRFCLYHLYPSLE